MRTVRDVCMVVVCVALVHGQSQDRFRYPDIDTSSPIHYPGLVFPGPVFPPPNYGQQVVANRFDTTVPTQRPQQSSPPQNSNNQVFPSNSYSGSSSSGSIPSNSYSGSTNNNPAPSVVSAPQRPDVYAEAVGSFTLELMRTASRGKQDNTVLSPFGIAKMLSLLNQATNGQTRAQIERALHMGADTSKNGFRRVADFNDRRPATKSDSEEASAVFVNAVNDIDPDFKAVASKDYHSDVLTANFASSAQTARTVNQWVSEVTRNKINDLFSADADFSTVEMILVNAMYFRGVWEYPFKLNKTTTSTFSPRPSQEIQASFMNQIAKFQGGEDANLGIKWLQMPFDGQDWTMLFILPTMQHNLDGVLERLTGADLLRIIRDETTRDAIVAIPRFSLSKAMSLQRTLSQLGVVDLFTSASTLQGLTRGTRYSTVSDFVHKATLSIDEMGSKAAAATGVVVNTLSLGSYYDDFRFVANQPFLAIIVDKRNNVPTFISRINDPTRP